MHDEWAYLGKCDLNEDPHGRSGPSSTVVSLICLGQATGTLPAVWKRLARILPKRALRWAKHREAAILAVYRGRSHRYAYPPAYRTRPVRFVQFPTEQIYERITSRR